MNKVLTVIAMGAMLPLCAQTEDIRFGVKAGLIQPQGKTFKTEARAGAQIGVSATKELGLGHAVRANIDFNQFSNKKVTINDYRGMKTKDIKSAIAKGNETDWVKNKSTVNTGSIGADYIYHLNKQGDGFYVIAGVDVEKTNNEKKEIKRETTDKGTVKENGKVTGQKGKWTTVSDTTKKEHKNKFGFKVGAGYDLDKNIGIEAAYSTHKHKTSDNKSDKHGVFGLGLTYKF